MLRLILLQFRKIFNQKIQIMTKYKIYKTLMMRVQMTKKIKNNKQIKKKKDFVIYVINILF